MTYSINNTALPIPASWAETYETIENVNQSEAGTDLCSLIRANKLSVTITSNLTELQKTALLSYSAAGTVSVKINGVTKTMRLRNVTADRVRFSERLATGELWECSYTITEV